MAGTFKPTSTDSNLTRIELEQVRRSDYFTNSKALTLGDSALSPEGVVGRGRLDAEPFPTSPTMVLDEVVLNSPPGEPGKGLDSLTEVYGTTSETVKWFGPTVVHAAASSGYPSANWAWRDDTPSVDFGALGVQSGDILLVKLPISASTTNQYAVGLIDSVITPHILGVPTIYNPHGSLPDRFDADPTASYPYVIIRRGVVRLFALPGSGPLGREQTFLTVDPTSTLHDDAGPTVGQINADRILNLVERHRSTDPSVDRADGVYPSPGPFQSLDKLGYRVVLYPDVGDGSGPDLSKPISTLSPVIDPAIPPEEQRVTVDPRAGVIRFSVAPATGGDIKPSGASDGTNPLTGRLNLYAVYWICDTRLTKGAAGHLWFTRSDETVSRTAARVRFDTTLNAWLIGATTQANDLYVRAPDPAEVGGDPFVEFGLVEGVGTRYFKMVSASNRWVFSNRLPAGNDPLTSAELGVADKMSLSMGDGAQPALSAGADATPFDEFVPGSGGLRKVDGELFGLLQRAATEGYGKVHLRKGRYRIEKTVKVPPGVTLEGEGGSTHLEGLTQGAPVLAFGPNTPWGVYDVSSSIDGVLSPTEYIFGTSTVVEGMDLDWNPNVRGWGVAQADLSTEQILFSVVSADGTKQVADTNLKVSGRTLYSNDPALPGSVYHTSGHFPRIAYHPTANVYVVAWVQLNSDFVGTGPEVVVRVFRVEVDGSITGIRTLTLGSPTVYYDMPSVAVDPNDTNNVYVSAARFDSVASRWYLAVNTIPIPVGLPSESLISMPIGTPRLVTSTDMTFDEDSTALVVWSEAAHPIYLGDDGTIAGGNTLTDTAYPSLGASATNISPGDRFHHLGHAAIVLNEGTDGVVTSVSGGASVTIKMESSPNQPWANQAGGVRWAITPVRVIRCSLWTGGAFTTGATLNDVTSLSAQYSRSLREPDFARVSYGAGRWAVAFQALHSTSALASRYMRNFDNGKDATFIDSAASVATSRYLYRQHVGTCVMLVSTSISLAPLATTATGIEPVPRSRIDVSTGDPKLLFQQTSSPVDAAMASLGTADPMVPRPNSMWTGVYASGGVFVPWGSTTGPHLQISARTVLHKWDPATGLVPSLIPDITWTGSDWIVVSPTKASLGSDTGIIRKTGGKTYLVDVSYYFGDGSKNVHDNNYLARTVDSHSQVYLPSTAAWYPILSVDSEHVVKLFDDTVTIPSPDGTVVSWWMASTNVAPGGGTHSGIKNLLFRLGADGQLLAASSRTLDTMDPAWISDMVPTNVVETVSRRFLHATLNRSTGGANLPMSWGTLNTFDGASTLRSGWDIQYPTSRLSGDIGFTGISPGAPRGYNERVPTEQPCVAICWGDNYFGFLDRYVSGVDSAAVNKAFLYRQAVGAYQSGATSLRVTAREVHRTGFDGGKSALGVDSRHLVHTRWGYPATASAGFATDGYLNCTAYVMLDKLPANGSSTDPNHMSGYLPSSLVDWGNAVAPRLGATYTDALGRHAHDVYGPQSPQNVYTGVYSMPMNDLASYDVQNPPIRALPYDPYVYPSSPVVLWDGTRFVAFWTEAVKQDVSDANFRVKGGYLHMAALPTGVDGVDAALTPPMCGDPFGGKHLAHVRLSCGNNLITDPDQADTYDSHLYACDAAFSGHTYAVLWIGGSNPHLREEAAGGPFRSGANGSTNSDIFADATTDFRAGFITNVGDVLVMDVGANAGIYTIVDIDYSSPTTFFQVDREFPTNDAGPLNYSIYRGRSGSTLGVAIFDGTDGQGAVANYLLTSSSIAGYHASPRILWDGTQFVAVWREGFRESFSVMKYLSIPEYGPGGPLQFHRVAAEGSKALGGYEALGRFINTALSTNDATIALNDASSFSGPMGTQPFGASNNQIQCQPGDILVISKTTIGGVDSTEAAGWYTVLEYDARNRWIKVDQQRNPALDGHIVYGSILSGGLSARSGLQRAAGPDVVIPAAAVVPDGVNVGDPRWSDVLSATTYPWVARILGVAHNDVSDEYAVMYFTQNRDLEVLTFRKGSSSMPRNRVILDNGTFSHNARTGSIGWNGSEYLVIWVDVTGGGPGDLRYAVLGPGLGIRYTGVMAYHHGVSPDSSCMVGNELGQVPGPLYGPYVEVADQLLASGTGNMQARVKKVEIRWNPTLGRWAVQASLCWTMEAQVGTAASKSHCLQPLVPLSYPLSPYTNPVGSLTNRSLAGNFPCAYIQPGLRLMFWDTAAKRAFCVMTVVSTGPKINIGGNDLFNGLVVDVHSSELTAAELASLSAGTTEVYVMHREDVFCWTLSPGAPVVQFVDADGAFLEDVEIGGAVDVSEKYTVSRPVWRSAGEVLGMPDEVASIYGATHVRDYARTLVSPGSIRLTNVRSRTRTKYRSGRRS